MIAETFFQGAIYKNKLLHPAIHPCLSFFCSRSCIFSTQMINRFDTTFSKLYMMLS